jgi:hypothetical protein
VCLGDKCSARSCYHSFRRQKGTHMCACSSMTRFTHSYRTRVSVLSKCWCVRTPTTTHISSVHVAPPRAQAVADRRTMRTRFAYAPAPSALSRALVRRRVYTAAHRDARVCLRQDASYASASSASVGAAGGDGSRTRRRGARVVWFARVSPDRQCCFVQTLMMTTMLSMCRTTADSDRRVRRD